MRARSLEPYVDQQVHWRGTTMSAHSDAGGPTGRNREHFVDCPVLSELQEAWERGGLCFIHGAENMKSLANKKTYFGGNEADREI